MKRITINLDRVESGPDLKVPSRSSTVYADRIDLLRARVDILTGRDKALMTMYLENGNTFRQMARIAGVNETTIAFFFCSFISYIIRYIGSQYFN